VPRLTCGVPGSFDATAQDHARLSAVLGAFREIAAAGEDGDVGSALKVLAGHACRLLSVNRCAIYLLDESSGLYRGEVFRAGDRFDDRIKRLVCGVQADDFTREILTTRRPVVIADARRDPRPIRSAIVELNVRTVLGVPMVLRGAIIGILYLDVEGAIHSFSEPDLQIARDFANLAAIAVANARSTAGLRASLETVAKQNAALRRAAIAENRLVELALAGADLGEIAQRVAELSSKPCAIYGPDGQRVGAGAPRGVAQAPALLEPEDCAGREIAQALAGIRAGTTSVIGPFRTAGFAHRLLISPVTVRGDEWGRVVVKEHGSRFSAFDAQVVRRAATIIALELSARRSATELGPSTEAMVRDLLSGLGNDDVLARRAEFHGLNVDDAHLMVLICDEGGAPSRAPRSEAVAAALAGRHNTFIAAVPEGVTLVRPVGHPADGDPVASAHAAATAIVGSLPSAGSWIGGISSTFSGVSGFKRAYHEARQVTRCLRTFAPHHTTRVLTADELGAGCLFLASTSRDEADQFVRHTLGPLVDLGDRSMRDLLSTLAVFLASSRCVRDAAQALGVHENTVRYRLARIAELSGLDVATNVDHQLAGQLATLVLRLEGALPAPTTVAIDAARAGTLQPANERSAQA
jgi:sugar diacid utilization regulator